MNFATNKAAPTEQKLRGGYYTPVSLAEYLCKWAIRDGGEKVLEPSCGDGNFLSALEAASADKEKVSVTAVELNSVEIAKAKSRVEKCQSISVSFKNGDFFEHYPRLKKEFDVVVGNPPFVRFQHFDAGSRDRAFESLRSHGYHPTKLANAWAAFVQLSVELLKPGGRLAMVIPAELLQVKYAEELRERITQAFDHVVIITFEQLVFEGIQQEVVLLLAEGKRAKLGTHCLVHTLELSGAHDLANLPDAIAHAADKHARKDVKWTALFLPEARFKTLQEASKKPGIIRLGEVADVDVGIVTGRNSWFVIDDERASQVKLNGFASPLVGRTSSLKSILFKDEDFQSHASKHPSRLIDLNGVDVKEMSKPLREYIKSGELAGVNDGYKCRIRRRWFDVPSVYSPDAFLFRQIHDAPLLVANLSGATSTDTIHRVRLKEGSNVDVKRLAAAFVNSLTFAWAEVCGRSYGGGVLELEPREAEELPIPLAAAEAIDIEKLDGLLRAGGVETALDYSDSIILRDGLGMKAKDIATLRDCWRQLRDRRKNRKHARKPDEVGVEVSV